MVKPFGENPGHLEVGYEPRAPSAGKATAGEASKAVPFNREMWIERRLFMRDEYLHSARQSLVHKDAAASDKLNMGCQSTALLRTSNPHNFFPDSPGGQYVDKMYTSARERGWTPNSSKRPWYK